MTAEVIDEAESKMMIESSQLYYEVFDSLMRGSALYLVDDYLSSIGGVDRIATRYDSNTACFVVRGHDSTRSVTFLLSTSRTDCSMWCPRNGSKVSPNNSYLNLTAGNLSSASLAIKKLAGNGSEVLPIDVRLILVGQAERDSCYQRFDEHSLRESILGRIGFGTHLVIVEPTGLRACSVQKGSLIFRLTIRGRAHDPAFPWLGENPWDMLMRFEERFAGTMKPKHNIYPVEVGKAPPMTLSSFLIGYPTMTPLRVEYDQPNSFGEQSSIEIEYYVSIPPEFPHKEFEDKFLAATRETARSSGCEASARVVYKEEPFREDAQSLIVRATSSAFLKVTGFEPIFEWLPYPVSAGNLKSNGFAKDIVVLGPGDWTMSDAQDKKTIITAALRASEILAKIPYEVASL